MQGWPSILIMIVLGADVHSAAISYAVNGRQFVTIPAGGALFTFGLPEGTPSTAAARPGGR